MPRNLTHDMIEHAEKVQNAPRTLKQLADAPEQAYALHLEEAKQAHPYWGAWKVETATGHSAPRGERDSIGLADILTITFPNHLGTPPLWWIHDSQRAREARGAYQQAKARLKYKSHKATRVLVNKSVDLL